MYNVVAKQYNISENRNTSKKVKHLNFEYDYCVALRNGSGVLYCGFDL